MFNVVGKERGEQMCACDSFDAAFKIACALRAYSGVTQQHFAVLKGDELKYDTRNGMVE